MQLGNTSSSIQHWAKGSVLFFLSKSREDFFALWNARLARICEEETDQADQHKRAGEKVFVGITTWAAGVLGWFVIPGIAQAVLSPIYIVNLLSGPLMQYGPIWSFPSSSCPLLLIQKEELHTFETQWSPAKKFAWFTWWKSIVTSI